MELRKCYVLGDQLCCEWLVFCRHHCWSAVYVILLMRAFHRPVYYCEQCELRGYATHYNADLSWKLEVRSRRIRVVASRGYREERVMSAVRWRTGERDLVPMVTSLLLTPRRGPARSLASYWLTLSSFSPYCVHCQNRLHCATPLLK